MIAADRWAVMLLSLAGDAPPPPLPGRVHKAPVPDGRDPYPAQHDRELQAARAWLDLASDGEGNAAD